MKTNLQKKPTVWAAQTVKSRNGTSGKNERKVAHRQSKIIQKASDGAPPRSTEGKKNSAPVAGTPVSRNSTNHAAVHAKKNIPATAAPAPESSGAIHIATLKKFATEARRKLIDQIGARLTFVLNEETAELKGKTGPIASLYRHIAQSSEKQVVEQVAYIWFNRFIALRFMDVNGYTTPRVLTPATGHTVPELLQDAKSGSFPDTLTIDRTRVMHLLDGKIKHPNPQGEAYRMLIVASCNAWNTVMPFLFEPIEDWTELLLPDDLLSDHSIVADICNGMSAEACRDEEVIGWLYQFYIAEKKDEVIGGLKKNIKITEENIPAATQLFTPHWIVRYMVENTLGKLWMQLRPSSGLRAHMEYYIEQEPSGPLPEGVTGIKDITFLDPCAGSGHILVYAFDLLHRMYEEEGYDIHEIPSLILQHNLFGLEIDDRAAALAGFALCMKGRSVDRRFFKRGVAPNVLPFEKIVFEDEEFENYRKKVGKMVFTPDFIENLKMLEQGKNFGSLIRPKVIDGSAIRNELKRVDVSGNLFLVETQRKVGVGLELIERLQRKYACVVTNPPYMGGKGMNDSIKEFLNKNYTIAKSDLFSASFLRCMDFSCPDGQLGFMSPFVWIFISSYEELRKYLIDKSIITSLIQLEYSGFEGATVPICTFTLQNSVKSGFKGSYIRLSDFRGSENQAPKTLEAIRNSKCGWFYKASADDFRKIPGSPVAYWVSEKEKNSYQDNELLGEVCFPRKGMDTGDNDKFLKFWYELSERNICFENTDHALRWFPYNKGGDFRRCVNGFLKMYQKRT